MLHVQIEVASVENPIKNNDVLSIGKLRSAYILYYSWYNSVIPSRVVRIYVITLDTILRYPVELYEFTL